MTDALKPCPFCGGKAYLANRTMPGCAFCVCTDCRAGTDDGSIEFAVTAWNRRANLPRPEDAARIAELEAALNEIDALDPEHLIDSCAQTAMRGLVLRMGEIARAALKGGEG